MCQFVLEEGACIGVGEEAGLFEYEPGDVGQVVDRRVVAVPVEPLLRNRIALLRSLTQSEQGLVAPHRSSPPGDVEDLLGQEVRGGQSGRRLREGAVAAAVTAEHGEGDEDLWAVGDATAVRPVPAFTGSGE